MSRLIVGLFAVALAVVPSAVPVTAAPVPKHLFPKDVLFFPTQVGAEWVYDDNGYKYVFVVKEVTEKDGAKLVEVHVRHHDGKGTQHSYTVEVTKTGVREVSNANRRIDPPTPLVKWPCKKDDTWETMFKLDGEYRADYAFRCAGFEEVKVPAGTFQALRVEKTSADPLTGKTIQTITTWYAPDIGPVCIKYGSTRELVKFTPGKGAPPMK